MSSSIAARRWATFRRSNEPPAPRWQCETCGEPRPNDARNLYGDPTPHTIFSLSDPTLTTGQSYWPCPRCGSHAVRLK